MSLEDTLYPEIYDVSTAVIRVMPSSPSERTSPSHRSHMNSLVGALEGKDEGGETHLVEGLIPELHGGGLLFTEAA